MIRFDEVSFTYDEADGPTLRDLSLRIDEGELWVVLGQTGSGKSTLLRAINGLVPHATGGHLSGMVELEGRSTRDHPPRELADLVGYVGQDPAASFVTDTVEDELAYTMENIGVPAEAMRRRVEDALDLLSLHELRRRPLLTLSGGQQQRVAIGAVLTASPRVLVLDEPTSALDPAAAEEVLAALSRLVHDLGLTVVMAEHRLERVVPFADRMILLPGDGATPVVGAPAEVMRTSPVAPPLVELGRLAKWDPMPLSVRDARRIAQPLREKLHPLAPQGDSDGYRGVSESRGRGVRESRGRGVRESRGRGVRESRGRGVRESRGRGVRESRGRGRSRGESSDDPTVSTSEAVAEVRRVSFAYGKALALHELSLTFAPGEVVALMGRNGAGKSTLLDLLAGVRAPQHGSVRIGALSPDGLKARHRIAVVGLVPQDPGLLLYGETVAGELAAADHDAGLDPGTTAQMLEAVLPSLDHARHPRDLSEGQRLALALAVVLGPRPRLVLLDEPTRGLDYPSKERLIGVLHDLSRHGHSVVLATHDVELAARVADRAVVLADGEVVADGPARQVVCHSPVFAPQVAKVLAPDPWLTVHEVRRGLEALAG